MSTLSMFLPFLLDMDNPWIHIPFDDYERHMSDPSVGQLSALNKIFQEQYTAYNPESLVIFGISTGNGLEHINPKITKRVVGIDVNKEYLQECASRYSSNDYELQLIAADLNHDSVTLFSSKLFVADLFLEYVDLQKFLSIVKEYGSEGAVLSTVIQLNNGNSFVSQTNIDSLATLSEYHVEIYKDELIETMMRNQFEYIFTKKYPLPSAKEFLRLDFRMT